MEAALRTMLQNSFGEYVEGLDKAQGASFPLVLRDLKLKEAKIQQELDEGDGNFPFDITSGRVGSITVSPGWMGTVEVKASNIVLNFAFAPMKAMNKAMNRKDDDSEDDEPVPQHRLQGMPMQQMKQRGPPPAPAAPVPPRYCSKHGTSEQRVKIEPRMVECASCHTTVQTNYSEFTLCPACSEREQKCMLCGCSAPNAGNYMPAMTANAQTPNDVPVFNAGGPPVNRQPSVSGQRGQDLSSPSRLTSQGGPSRQQSGNVPPPPPPVGFPPRTPSNVRADLDWLESKGAPPPPPPPMLGASNRSSFAPSGPGGSTRQVNPGSMPPQSSGRAPPGPNPMQPNRQRQQMSMQTNRSQQDKSSGSSLLGYLQNFQIPTLDISSWASCINAADMRSYSETETPAGASANAQPWRGGA